MAVAVTDDATIGSGDIVYRRLSPQWVLFDANDGRWRVNSGAFSRSSDDDAVSGDLKSLIDQSGKRIEETLTDPNFGVAALLVETLRANGFGVVRDPRPENPYHVLIFGGSRSGHAKKLLSIATPIRPVTRDGNSISL